MFDLNALAKKCSVWSGDGVVIAAAATRIHAAYLKLEPTARAAIVADEQALIASWLELDAAFDAYSSASNISRVSTGMAVVNTIAKTTPVLTRIARDGETLFQADRPVIKPDVDLTSLHTRRKSHDMSIQTRCKFTCESIMRTIQDGAETIKFRAVGSGRANGEDAIFPSTRHGASLRSP